MSSGTPCSYQAQSAPLDPGEWSRVCARIPLSVRYLSGPWASSLGLTGMDKEKDMKRIIIHRSKVVLVLAALVCTAGPVWADSPHFIGTPTATIDPSDGSLDVKFKEAGLGLGAIDYVVNADAAITCVCATKKGNCPNAANKITGFSAVSGEGTFSPKHGTVSQTLTVAAPSCGNSAQPTCGGGQHFEVTDLTYTNIKIADCSTPVPGGTTCADTDGDGTVDTLTAGGLATSPNTLSAGGLFVCP
jgi:hypothetical protein